MEDSEDTRLEPSAHWNWSIGLLGLVLIFSWQTWLALGLFGPDAPWHTLLDERPVLSGSHPQHLYLGSLGAQALAANGTSWPQAGVAAVCLYDPAFQAGYPKTPIFNGSRLAEVILLIGGGTYNPAAYKVGLLVICLLVPVLLALACLGTGLAPGTSLVAIAGGVYLSWGPAGRLALEAGEADLLLASLGMLAHAGMLIRFHRVPGFLSWLGMWLTGSIVWFSQPLVFPLALPLLLFYYLCVGARHAAFTWHATLLVAQVAPWQ